MRIVERRKERERRGEARSVVELRTNIALDAESGKPEIHSEREE